MQKYNLNNVEEWAILDKPRINTIISSWHLNPLIKSFWFYLILFLQVIFFWVCTWKMEMGVDMSWAEKYNFFRAYIFHHLLKTFTFLLYLMKI